MNESEWQQFNVELQNCLSNNIPFQHLLNSNFLSSSISENYQEVIDKFMPLQKQKQNSACPDKPWITAGFKVSINKKMVSFS